MRPSTIWTEALGVALGVPRQAPPPLRRRGPPARSAPLRRMSTAILQRLADFVVDPGGEQAERMATVEGPHQQLRDGKFKVSTPR